MENPNNFLSTIQVGITFISLLQGASLSASLGGVIASWFGDFVWAQTAGSVISLVFLTYISIVLGELYPKRIAMNLKENLAVISAPVIIFLGKIVSPFVWLLSASTNLLSRITPMQFDDADEKMTRDEIEYMLSNSEETLDAEEIEMLQGIFSLDELMAREVMVPRTDAFMIDINDDTQENIQEILKQNFHVFLSMMMIRIRLLVYFTPNACWTLVSVMVLTILSCVRFCKNRSLFQKRFLWTICYAN